MFYSPRACTQEQVGSNVQDADIYSIYCELYRSNFA